MHLRLHAVCLASLGLAACSFNPNGGDNIDAAEVDGAIDAAVIDAEVDGAIDAAAIDAPAIDAPAIDAPAIDAPAIDGPVIDGPVIDAPAIDAPAIDAPAIDAPAIDAPVDAPIDAAVDAPIDARANCTGYDVSYGGATYVVRGAGTSMVAPASYTNAKTDCENDDPGRTHLATFEVAADLHGLLSTLSLPSGGTDFTWVGADCANNCGSMASWFWNFSNTAVATSLWEGGQPNNSPSAAAAHYNTGATQWRLYDLNATNMAVARPYICECEP